MRQGPAHCNPPNQSRSTSGPAKSQARFSLYTQMPIHACKTKIIATPRCLVLFISLLALSGALPRRPILDSVIGTWLEPLGVPLVSACLVSPAAGPYLHIRDPSLSSM
jgi:hypothetical protein